MTVKKNTTKKLKNANVNKHSTVATLNSQSNQEEKDTSSELRFINQQLNNITYQIQNLMKYFTEDFSEFLDINDLITENDKEINISVANLDKLISNFNKLEEEINSTKNIKSSLGNIQEVLNTALNTSKKLIIEDLGAGGTKLTSRYQVKVGNQPKTYRTKIYSKTKAVQWAKNKHLDKKILDVTPTFNITKFKKMLADDKSSPIIMHTDSDSGDIIFVDKNTGEKIDPHEDMGLNVENSSPRVTIVPLDVDANILKHIVF